MEECMKFITGYIWQKDCQEISGGYRESSVLVLQVKKGQIPIVFACICEGETDVKQEAIVSGYATEQLQNWFYHNYSRIRRSGSGLEKDWKRLWTNICCELQEYSVKKSLCFTVSIIGMLVEGNRFWLLQQGNCKAYLMNQRYLHSHIREIKTEQLNHQSNEHPVLINGYLQKGIGILLCTEGFYGNFTEDMLCDCLATQDITEEIQITKRLNELAQASNDQNSNCGCGSAAYIKVM